MRKLLLIAVAVGGLALLDANASQAQSFGIQIGNGGVGGFNNNGYYAPAYSYGPPRYYNSWSGGYAPRYYAPAYYGNNYYRPAYSGYNNWNGGYNSFRYGYGRPGYSRGRW